MMSLPFSTSSYKSGCCRGEVFGGETGEDGDWPGVTDAVQEI